MNELDRIRIADHFDFELLLEGSDLGNNSGYGDSLGDSYFYTHGRFSKLLKLNRKRQYD